MAIEKHKMKNEEVSLGGYYDFEGPLKSLRDYLDGLIEKYGEEACLNWDWYYDDVTLMLRYQRQETEKEATTRIRRAKKAAETRKKQKLKKEEAERALLAKLKKKYEE